MTDPMSPEELRACRERAEAATAGPWSSLPIPGCDRRVVVSHERGARSRVATVCSWDRVAENSAFIAEARTDVPRLLATVDAERAAVAAREERIAELASELADLRRRVVANVTHGKQQPHPRWAHVMRATGYGSTRATELCRLAGFDPDEEIGSWPEPCEACAEEEGDEESEDE